MRPNDISEPSLLEPDGYKTVMASMSSAETLQGGSFQNGQGETLVRIPSADILTQRLETYIGEALLPYMAQKLYPQILKMAGHELLPVGVALEITLAVYDACEDLPPMNAPIMDQHLPGLVSALVPDETLHAEILAILNG